MIERPPHLSSLKKLLAQEDIKAVARDWLRRLRIWLRQFRNSLLQVLVTYGVTVILYICLLYFARYLWALYLETPVGKRFIADHIAYVGVVENVLGHNFILLALRITSVILTVCLIIGIVGRALLVLRYFYDPHGFFYRLGVWGMLSAIVTSLAIHQTLRLDWSVSFLLGFVPTLLLFNCCFEFTLRFVPEISTVFSGVVSLTKKGFQTLMMLNPQKESSRLRVKAGDSVPYDAPERRSEPRQNADFSIRYYRPESNAIDESVAFQVSNRGFCLWQPRDADIGDNIRFTLRVDTAVILGEAQIKWVDDASVSDRNATLPSKAGCRIISMDKEHESVLQSYLTKHEERKREEDGGRRLRVGPS